MSPSFLRPAHLALFLTLLATACDGGGGGAVIVEPPPAIPDSLRLLTDAELTTPEDPTAPVENAAWAEWVAANHAPLRSLTSTDFQDLQFLKPLLAGRRVVQLGESGHGVRQFTQAKVRLIRFLHEEMGYDVIAFESSLHDCWQTNHALAGASSHSAMRDCLFYVWHTEDVLGLMDYVRRTRTTANPLVLAGFDVQPSGRGQASSLRPALLRSVLVAADSGFSERLHALDAQVTALWDGGQTAYGAFLSAHNDSLTRAYARAEELIVQHRVAIDARFAAEPQRPEVALATVRGMRVFLRQIAATGEERYSIRDAGMADNVDALLDELYPGKKVILWGHNSHVANAPVIPTRINMGTLVHQRRGAEVYTVGLFMYSGSAADNVRTVYPIPLPHPAGSLESLLYRARRRWVFVDFSTRAEGAGTSWMFQPIAARSWGVNTETVVPRDFYDGVLFIHTVTAPPYVQ
ncbi:MAG TPA: erythromycin esterase family protein [Longimicrobium sp.]|nr:erythromycin esterase family protein [Longimicrobium sp.]